MMRAFQPSEQGRAGGMFGMGVVLAPALGPSIGGILVDLFGWRSIFFMVVPFCLVAIWLSHRYIPVNAPGGEEAGRHAAPLVWRGLVLGSVGTLALLNGLLEIRGGNHWLAGGLLLLAVLSFAGLVLWLRRAQRLGQDALLDPAVFRHRAYAIGSLVAFIYGIGLYGSTYLLLVFMQLACGTANPRVGTILPPSGFVQPSPLSIAGRRRAGAHARGSGAPGRRCSRPVRKCRRWGSLPGCGC